MTEATTKKQTLLRIPDSLRLRIDEEMREPGNVPRTPQKLIIKILEDHYSQSHITTLQSSTSLAHGKQRLTRNRNRDGSGIITSMNNAMSLLSDLLQIVADTQRRVHAIDKFTPRLEAMEKAIFFLASQQEKLAPVPDKIHRIEVSSTHIADSIKSIANNFSLSTTGNDEDGLVQQQAMMEKILSTLTEIQTSILTTSVRTSNDMVISGPVSKPRIASSIDNLLYTDTKKKNAYWTEATDVNDDEYQIVVNCSKQSSLRIGNTILLALYNEYEEIIGADAKVLSNLISLYAARTFSRDDETLIATPEKTISMILQHIRVKIDTAKVIKHMRTMVNPNQDIIIGEVPVLDLMLPVKVWKSYADSMQAKYPELNATKDLKNAITWMTNNPGKQRAFVLLNEFFVNWLEGEVKKHTSGPKGKKGQIAQSIANAKAKRLSQNNKNNTVDADLSLSSSTESIAFTIESGRTKT